MYRRYQKTVSPNQIQSQKLILIQVRPSLYVDPSHPCLSALFQLLQIPSNHCIQGSKLKCELTEQVLVEYAVEVEVSAHGACMVREVVAEVALEVIFHVAENVGLEVPEVKMIGGIASMQPEKYKFVLSPRTLYNCALWGVPSFLKFCKVCFTCPTGRLAIITAILQPNW